LLKEDRRKERMKLFTLGVPYTTVNRNILLLSSRNAILKAIRLYGGIYLTSKAENAIRRRKEREDLREVERCGLVSTNTDGIPCLNEIPPNKAFEVPTKLPWDDLSLAELKTCIALYASAKNQRSPFFTFQGTREDLAEIARLNRKATGLALNSLSRKGICRVKPVRDEGSRWTKGVQVQLLDRNSGQSLNNLAWFFIKRTPQLGPTTLYRMALRPQLDDASGYFRNFKLTCPLCLDSKKTLRVTVTEDEDLWSCGKCGKFGDSNALASLRSYHLWKEPEFNLTEMASVLGFDQAQPQMEATNEC
jgi:hypothetical protein